MVGCRTLGSSKMGQLARASSLCLHFPLQLKASVGAPPCSRYPRKWVTESTQNFRFSGFLFRDFLTSWIFHFHIWTAYNNDTLSRDKLLFTECTLSLTLCKIVTLFEQDISILILHNGVYFFIVDFRKVKQLVQSHLANKSHDQDSSVGTLSFQV